MLSLTFGLTVAALLAVLLVEFVLNRIPAMRREKGVATGVAAVLAVFMIMATPPRGAPHLIACSPACQR